MRISGRALLWVLAGSLLLAGPAYAHADYLRSVPGEDSVVSSPPAQVDIWFTQELFRRQGENRIEVFGPGEQPVHAGEAQIEDDDRTHLWVELLPDLAPGEYRVEWRSLSAEDGDTEEGAFRFTFDTQAEQTSTPMAAPGAGQATASPGAPTAAIATPLAPPAGAASGTPTHLHTPMATASGREPQPGAPANRCLPGALTLSGLAGIVWTLRRRKPFSP